MKWISEKQKVGFSLRRTVILFRMMRGISLTCRAAHDETISDLMEEEIHIKKKYSGSAACRRKWCCGGAVGNESTETGDSAAGSWCRSACNWGAMFRSCILGERFAEGIGEKLDPLLKGSINGYCVQTQYWRFYTEVYRNLDWETIQDHPIPSNCQKDRRWKYFTKLQEDG